MFLSRKLVYDIRACFFLDTSYGTVEFRLTVCLSVRLSIQSWYRVETVVCISPVFHLLVWYSSSLSSNAVTELTQSTGGVSYRRAGKLHFFLPKSQFMSEKLPVMFMVTTDH